MVSQGNRQGKDVVKDYTLMCIISIKKVMKEVWDNRQYENFRWFNLSDIYGFKIDVVKEFSKNDVSVLRIKHVFKCAGRKLEKDLTWSDIFKFYLWLETTILVTQGTDTTYNTEFLKTKLFWCQVFKSSEVVKVMQP